uniref:Uncharacterized protein n=1 Tax=Vespula pensylvanica TaxID=30213 RepID=A0A834P3C9_VESPE|nr:hypothetical protein H0235_008142 [Vespula pensylvanica]
MGSRRLRESRQLGGAGITRRIGSIATTLPATACPASGGKGVGRVGVADRDSREWLEWGLLETHGGEASSGISENRNSSSTVPHSNLGKRKIERIKMQEAPVVLSAFGCREDGTSKHQSVVVGKQTG